MLKRKRNNVLLLISFLLIALSCTKDVDFDQADDISFEPIAESNLVFFDFTNEELVDETTQQEFLTLLDTTRIEVISQSFFVDKMVRTDITIEFTNSFQRDFNMDILFLDDNEDLKYAIETYVPEGTLANPIVAASTSVIEVPEIDTFKEATKIVVRIELPPTSTPITPTTEGSIKLRSKATFYFDF